MRVRAIVVFVLFLIALTLAVAFPSAWVDRGVRYVVWGGFVGIGSVLAVVRTFRITRR